jgi:hypothetical protein
MIIVSYSSMIKINNSDFMLFSFSIYMYTEFINDKVVLTSCCGTWVPVFRMRPYKPRQKVWHDKDPSLLKSPECRA